MTLRVDTKTIVHGGGAEKIHVAVIGNPCDDEVEFPYFFQLRTRRRFFECSPCLTQGKLDQPFVQPFDGRRTTIRRDGYLFYSKLH